ANFAGASTRIGRARAPTKILANELGAAGPIVLSVPARVTIETFLAFGSRRRSCRQQQAENGRKRTRLHGATSLDGGSVDRRRVRTPDLTTTKRPYPDGRVAPEEFHHRPVVHLCRPRSNS